MGGHEGRPVEEGVQGIIWAATLPDNGPVEDFSLMASLLPSRQTTFISTGYDQSGGSV